MHLRVGFGQSRITCADHVTADNNKLVNTHSASISQAATPKWIPRSEREWKEQFLFLPLLNSHTNITHLTHKSTFAKRRQLAKELISILTKQEEKHELAREEEKGKAGGRPIS